MSKHDIFTNSPFGRGDFVLNYFYENASAAKTAQLACPFFTSSKPLEIIRNAGGGRIQLLVRLCEATAPVALRSARSTPDVHIRFFTDETFHAKFYILGENALIGSANLTIAGLTTNREVAVLLTSEDERFDELPALFDELWQRASVLTDAAMHKFQLWHQSLSAVKLPQIDGIETASPATINVASQIVERTRTYLESFRQLYYENIIPNHKMVSEMYTGQSSRHPQFLSYPLEYEIDRFLSWTKLTFTTDETLSASPLRAADDLDQNIEQHIKKWFSATVKIDTDRVHRIAALKQVLQDERALETVSFDELTDALLGCAAFTEQSRFTKGSEKAMIQAFKRDNNLERVKKSFHQLAFGEDEFIRRTYDCIYAPELRLRHFGRNSVLELFGWTNKEGVPPINGRTIKALRYLGCDVRY